MPNDVAILMKVEGNADAIAAFAENHFNKEQFDLNSFIPMPAELKGTKAPVDEANPDLIDRHGYDNWYDWAIANWSTKWNSYNGDMDVDTPTTITCNFQTAWSLPDPVFEKMAEMYPELDFHIKCVEKGGFFSGHIEITDGAVDDSGITADQVQWRRIAKEMMGWEFVEEEKEAVQLVLSALHEGKITNQSIVNEMILFMKENMDEFIEFSKPK